MAMLSLVNIEYMPKRVAVLNITAKPKVLELLEGIGGGRPESHLES